MPPGMNGWSHQKLFILVFLAPLIFMPFILNKASEPPCFASVTYLFSKCNGVFVQVHSWFMGKNLQMGLQMGIICLSVLR